MGRKMKKSGIPAIVTAVAALVSIIFFGACSNDHNVNSGNLVTMSGFVFQSRTNKVPVPGVTVLVEKSSESSSAAIIPDQFTVTDESGRWEVKYSLSYLSTGDEKAIPVEPIPIWMEESMRIIMFSPRAEFTISAPDSACRRVKVTISGMCFCPIFQLTRIQQAIEA